MLRRFFYYLGLEEPVGGGNTARERVERDSQNTRVEINRIYLYY